MTEQEKQSLSAIMFQVSTIRLLTDERQVLNATARIEKIIAELFKQEEVSLKA